mgnify:CR=1 FL=1
MSIADEKITVKDFLRVYNKNMDLVQDQSQKNIDDYLKLYINYKLKLKEAYGDIDINFKTGEYTKIKNNESDKKD